MFFQMTGEGSGAPGVSFRYSVGCDVGCVVFEACVSSPHCIAWVRALQCAGMLLWFEAGGRHRWSLRSHFVARWGSACVFPFLYPSVFVLCSHYFTLGEGVYFFPFSRVLSKCRSIYLPGLAGPVSIGSCDLPLTA